MKSRIVLVVLLLSSSIVACQTPKIEHLAESKIEKYEYAEAIREAHDQLDALAAYHDEYGTISVSGVSLIRDTKKRFAFELKKLTPDAIFERNRVEGSGAELDLLAASVRGSVQAQFPEISPALPEGTTQAPLVDPPAPPGATAASALPSPTLRQGQSILDPGQLNLNLRDAIRLASDDHMTLQLLEWLSDPNDDTRSRVLYAAVLNVAVRPGWRTSEGYVGELDVRVSLCSTSACERDTRELKFPQAVAVFPGVDAQVLDLRSSFRRQLALALLIEAQGPEVGGAIDTDLVRRLEQDLATQSAVNTVVGYNASGFHFGWRFSPALRALANAADPGSGAGNVLRPQSFPALVFLALDKEDIPTSRGGACHYATKPDEPAKDATQEKKNEYQNKLKDYEKKSASDTKLKCPAQELTHLYIDSSVRWVRSQKSDPGGGAAPTPDRTSAAMPSGASRSRTPGG